jgi:hypothetical protein
MQIVETDVKKYERRSAEGLHYYREDNIVSISNRFNEKIVELILPIQADGVLCDKWFGYINNDEYKEIMSGPILEFFSELGCRRKICDTQKLVIGMDSETSLWFNHTFIPQMIDAGLTYNAIVSPKENYARQSMEFFERTLENRYAMFFPTFEISLSWMKILGEKGTR